MVVKGPGRGGFRPIFVGMNSVGRDGNQRISLSFGDDMISREEHAFIAYDEESRRFYLQHGGKANLVRLGGPPGAQLRRSWSLTTSSASARPRCGSFRCAGPISPGATSWATPER